MSRIDTLIDGGGLGCETLRKRQKWPTYLGPFLKNISKHPWKMQSKALLWRDVHVDFCKLSFKQEG